MNRWSHSTLTDREVTLDTYAALFPDGLDNVVESLSRLRRR